MPASILPSGGGSFLPAAGACPSHAPGAAGGPTLGVRAAATRCGGPACARILSRTSTAMAFALPGCSSTFACLSAMYAWISSRWARAAAATSAPAMNAASACGTVSASTMHSSSVLPCAVARRCNCADITTAAAAVMRGDERARPDGVAADCTRRAPRPPLCTRDAALASLGIRPPSAAAASSCSVLFGPSLRVRGYSRTLRGNDFAPSCGPGARRSKVLPAPFWGWVGGTPKGPRDPQKGGGP